MQQLTLADEIVVLMLDDTVGEIKPGCLPIAPVTIAGGVLMELALQGRIDTDLTALFVVNPQPTGDELLDEVLQEIEAEAEQHPSAWWIGELSTRHADLVERVLGGWWRRVSCWRKNITSSGCFRNAPIRRYPAARNAKPRPG